MKMILKSLSLLVICSLILAACGADLPPLAETDEPTVVYIYTDG